MVRLMEGEQECNNRTQTAGLVLGPDKRTGTFGSHVIDGVEDLQEPGQGRRFLSGQIVQIHQRFDRDLWVRAAS